jgi:hypothetical protein
MLDRREREIDKSWLAHDPSRARIPPKAWRALRNFKRIIGPQHWLAEMACAEHKTVQTLMLDYSRKSAVGSSRAYAKVVRHFEPAVVEKIKKGILWTWLQPRGCILADARDHGEAQDAILVRRALQKWLIRRLDEQPRPTPVCPMPAHSGIACVGACVADGRVDHEVRRHVV